MPASLIDILCAADDSVRHTPLATAVEQHGAPDLLREAAQLDRFWRQTDNLYQRVRALLFLAAIHRFELPRRPGLPACGHIPQDGFAALLERRFTEAIDALLAAAERQGPNEAVSSALAAAYRGHAFQTLADQVRRSVRLAEGNAWMFEIHDAEAQPLRAAAELAPRADAPGPWLTEHTAVRLDLSHSAWSDIFFLGMDYPEGARVLNLSIDLAVRGRDTAPRPPIAASVRILPRPVLRLASDDLGADTEIHALAGVFDFARDHLGLLRAAVISAGVVPPSLEGSGADLGALLGAICGPGNGLEVRSHVRGIPKGSRLAVSTNLLASLIAVLMRATQQTASLTGGLTEAERRVVAARAILGEWLGGSGGGWQDSGGIWPGAKRISGVLAGAGDPEDGISRGRLLPAHTLLDDSLAPGALDAVRRSLVLIHGGLAQNVGPVLEMVTEKYLLRSAYEWRCRQRAVALFDDIHRHLANGAVRPLAAATTDNFDGPIRGIIPAADNLYTARLRAAVQERFGDDFWGFCMLGGMSGGGMGLWFAPAARARALDALPSLLQTEKDRLVSAMPFAMDPVVYDFALSDTGTVARLEAPEAAAEARTAPPPAEAAPRSLDAQLTAAGFDLALHEQVRAALRSGAIGLRQNRLPPDTTIEDVGHADVLDGTEPQPAEVLERGSEALAQGRVAVVTLAAGVGSRWSGGSGVVKALHPFAVLGQRHRTFLEVHLAKSRRTTRAFGQPLPHVFTTSRFTHDAIDAHLDAERDYHYPAPLRLSPGRAVGLRMVPMVADLEALWSETAQQRLDEQAQKVRESAQAALADWARAAGEASDYTDNEPHQCLHPVGHWFEVGNLLRNGTLAELLALRPQLDHLLLHNIDTVGATVDPGLLGMHLAAGGALTFEVVPRCVDDRGGGLARVDGRLRLVESLALPRPELELGLRYYNSMTTWIAIDPLLAAFGLDRAALADELRVRRAVRAMAARLPTYVTLKDVVKRWGHAQEDVFTVCQFEKLWGDMTTLDDVDCRYLEVPRFRGQQLKDPAQLDGWLRDGSAAAVESWCEF